MEEVEVGQTDRKVRLRNKFQTKKFFFGLQRSHLSRNRR